jgi:hypothetical protein
MAWKTSKWRVRASCEIQLLRGTTHRSLLTSNLAAAYLRLILQHRGQSTPEAQNRCGQVEPAPVPRLVPPNQLASSRPASVHVSR